MAGIFRIVGWIGSFVENSFVFIFIDDMVARGDTAIIVIPGFLFHVHHLRVRDVGTVQQKAIQIGKPEVNRSDRAEYEKA